MNLQSTTSSSTIEPILLLACPQCGGALKEQAAGLSCVACAIAMPVLGRVPWLYRDPQAKLAEWRHLMSVAMEDFRRQEERLKAAGRVTPLSDIAKKRLQKELQARVEHRKAVETLVAPLGAVDAGPVDLLRVLAGKSANTQTLSSYAVNAVRDWGWSDTEENARALAIVLETLGSEGHFQSMAVLGSGAGRLAYDLHQAKVARTTVTVDINPYLTFVAEKMFAGKSVVVQEFPLAPDGWQNVAIPRKLSAPSKPEAGLMAVFGDVLNAPLARNAFDIVVTPWLLDILPEAPAPFMARINALLKPGGTWLNHGSCAFQQGAPDRHVSRDELLQLVGESGFKLGTERQDRMSYLSSPASCQGRLETVTTFVAKKIQDVPKPEPYRSLPPWLLDPTRPLPRPEGLVRLQSVHAYHAEVLSLIDGQRDALEVGQLLAAKYQLDPAQAGQALIGFLVNMYDLSSH